MADVPLFELRGISKEFPGVKALDDVSFEIRAGEVHMLVGENGAGKSTLMKILCGAYRADRGEFFNNGEPVTIHGAGAARKFGIAVIFQDFTLVPYLDIAQNIFSAANSRAACPASSTGAASMREAKRVLDGIGFDIDPREPVHSLGVAQQQMVEIAKALSQDARILVMDEPTAALSDHETEKLFAMIARLKAKGVAIIYISHRLSEVFALGDRITVLRDGRKIADLLPKETTPDQLVHADGRAAGRHDLYAAGAAGSGRGGAGGQEPIGTQRVFRRQSDRARRRNRRPVRAGRLRPHRSCARDLRRRPGDRRRDQTVRRTDRRTRSKPRRAAAWR